MRVGETASIAASLVAAAFLLRLPQFGNPVIHIDEQFYLLVGQFLVQGELPYVDIWDRKPLGLFLIYGGIALLGGDGVIQYQLVATLFAAATAILVSRIAIRYTTAQGAALAGLCYLASLGMLAGGGGQSPVFYNLFTAGAALLTLRAANASSEAAFLRRGLSAMLFMGLVLFIKQTAFAEGAFFGAWLLWNSWIRTKSLRRVGAYATAFAACGIAPTLGGLMAYVIMGHGDEFWFANVVSIFLKQPLGWSRVLNGAALLLISLLPLAACAAAGVRVLQQRRQAASRQVHFLIGWLIAAFCGFLSVPNFFDHYALPLLVPVSVAAAPVFAAGRSGRLAAAVPLFWALVVSSYPNWAAASGAAEEFEQVATAVKRHLRGGCLYVHEGPTHLYSETGACRVTRFIFPEHLRSAAEASAIGVDQHAELRRVLSAGPTVIVTSEHVWLPDNPTTRDLLRDELRRNYRQVDVVTLGLGGMRQSLQVWARRHPGTSAIHPKQTFNSAALDLLPA